MILSIRQYLVSEMGGQISAQSEEGKGSEFSFSIKLGLASQKKVDIDVSTNSDDSTAHVTGKRILIVEDQATNRMIAELILQRNGYEVESVENGQLAVELIGDGTSSFDLILMDIQMPIMDGIEATKLIRKKFTSEELPIVAMTAHAMGEEKQKCEDAGMNAHVSKPVDVNVLLRELNRCLS